MDRNEIEAIIRATMPRAFYDMSGAVLLSGPDTLRSAPVYVMGLNPGGSPTEIPTSIVNSIAPPNGVSAYTHECWQPHCRELQPCSHLDHDGSTKHDYLVRHQKNMIALAATLGAKPSTLFSANAVFGRSTSRVTLLEQTGKNLQTWWDVCWPVHQRFLTIVRPRILVTLGYGDGSSAFGLLRAMSGYPTATRIGDETRRGGWTFDTQISLTAADTLSVKVVGVPHPSYFAPGPLLAERLAAIVR